MEISLEKIELVKDRTGVNYKEAKEALIKAGGSVVDAIIMLEDEIDLTPKSKAGDQASQLIERIKQLVKKGNVSRIVVKREGEVLLNIPVTIGILGAVCVFWPTVVATIIALGTRCSIELIKDNGDIVSLSDKASDTLGDVKENCSVIADDLKDKSGEAFTQVKDRAADVISKAKSAVTDLGEDEFSDEDDDEPDFCWMEDEETDADIDIDIDGFDDLDDLDGFDDLDDLDDLDDDGEGIDTDDYFNFDDFAEPDEEEATDEEEAADEEEPADAGEAPDGEKKEDDLVDKFEETIEDYKKKKSRFKLFD